MICKETEILLDLTGTVFQDYEKSSLLFFDIETTGFRAENSQLYLIGAVYFQNKSFRICQWLAQNPAEEPKILETFLKLAEHYSTLVHFNGERFDVPYLQEKCRKFQLPDTLFRMNGRDLYRMVRPLKKLLKLEALNQRSLEEFLGIFRKDPYDGGELIHVYRKYVKNPAPENLQTLLLHNYEDLCGMLSVISLLSYLPILQGMFRVTGVETQGKDLVIRTQLPYTLPQPFSYGAERFYVKGEKDGFSVLVKGERKALKYFFADYRNYYYLPTEDTAIHKSVAAYVDREYREPAKASTCYSRKEGFYLPQFEEMFQPVFRENYADKQCFFACTPDFLKDREKLAVYVKHLLKAI